MPQWNHTLDVADVFRDDDSPFENRRDMIVARIRNAAFWNEDDLELVDLVQDLESSSDENEFDVYWDYFYDWADVKRVWVETF